MENVNENVYSDNYTSMRHIVKDKKTARKTGEKLPMVEHIKQEFYREFDCYPIRFVVGINDEEYFAVHDVRVSINYNVTEAISDESKSLEVLVKGHGDLRFMRVRDVIENPFKRPKPDMIRFIKWAKKNFIGPHEAKPKPSDFAAIPEPVVVNHEDPYKFYVQEDIRLTKDFKRGDFNKDRYFAEKRLMMFEYKRKINAQNAS